MNIKSWFKSNIKRYFEIDVNTVEDKTNNQIWLHQDSHLSSLHIAGDIGNFERHIRDSRSIRVYDNDVGCNKKRTRHDKNGCGTFSTKTNRYRTTFFIEDPQQKHFHNLNTYVYQPLSVLGLQDLETRNNSNTTYPSWRKYFVVNGIINDDFLTDTATMHLMADGLLNEINEYKQLLKLHRRRVESLPLVISCIVKSKFIESGIYPTVPNNYHNIGYYHFGDIDYLLQLVWEDLIYYGDDIATFRAKNNIASLTYSSLGDILKLGNWVIGNGNEAQRVSMQQVLSSVPQIHIIINAFRDLRESKLELDSRAERIRNLANPLRTKLVWNQYTTQCTCCPIQND